MADTGPLHRFANGYKGVLYQQQLAQKNWKRRFFQLDNQRLIIYSGSKEGPSDKPLNEFCLSSDIEVFSLPDDAASGRTNVFCVSNNGDMHSTTTSSSVSTGSSTNIGVAGKPSRDIIYLSAESEIEKNEWIEAIYDATHYGFKIIQQPELWHNSFYPSLDLSITYPESGVSIRDGNIVKPSSVSVAPLIDLVVPSHARSLGHENAKHCLVMIDFDYPRSNSESVVFLMWGVVDIANSDVRSGKELAPYRPPAPQAHSGLHRFFFLLFRQTESALGGGSMRTSQRRLTEEMFRQREGFGFFEWAKAMNFSDPVAINGFYSGWEPWCDGMHDRLQYLPPTRYRSDAQKESVNTMAEQVSTNRERMDLYNTFGLSDMIPEQQFTAYGDLPIPSAGVNNSRVSNTAVNAIRMKITYADGGGMVNHVNQISPASVKNPPIVRYRPRHPEERYTLILSDPDWPSGCNPEGREYVHWIVANIPGSDIEQGAVVLAYEGPAPMYSTGLHRCVFTLYSQGEKQLNAHEIEACKRSFNSRMHYTPADPTPEQRSSTVFEQRAGVKTFDWVKQFVCPPADLESPIGLEMFLAEWDDNVDSIHAARDFQPTMPRYRSPRQHQHRGLQRNGMSGSTDGEGDGEGEIDVEGAVNESLDFFAMDEKQLSRLINEKNLAVQAAEQKFQARLRDAELAAAAARDVIAVEEKVREGEREGKDETGGIPAGLFGSDSNSFSDGGSGSGRHRTDDGQDSSHLKVPGASSSGSSSSGSLDEYDGNNSALFRDPTCALYRRWDDESWAELVDQEDAPVILRELRSREGVTLAAERNLGVLASSAGFGSTPRLLASETVRAEEISRRVDEELTTEVNHFEELVEEESTTTTTLRSKPRGVGEGGGAGGHMGIPPRPPAFSGLSVAERQEKKKDRDSSGGFSDSRGGGAASRLAPLDTYQPQYLGDPTVLLSPNRDTLPSASALTPSFARQISDEEPLPQVTVVSSSPSAAMSSSSLSPSSSPPRKGKKPPRSSTTSSSAFRDTISGDGGGALSPVSVSASGSSSSKKNRSPKGSSSMYISRGDSGGIGGTRENESGSDAFLSSSGSGAASAGANGVGSASGGKSRGDMDSPREGALRLNTFSDLRSGKASSGKGSGSDRKVRSAGGNIPRSPSVASMSVGGINFSMSASLDGGDASNSPGFQLPSSSGGSGGFRHTDGAAARGKGDTGGSGEAFNRNLERHPSNLSSVSSGSGNGHTGHRGLGKKKPSISRAGFAVAQQYQHQQGQGQGQGYDDNSGAPISPDGFNLKNRRTFSDRSMEPAAMDVVKEGGHGNDAYDVRKQQQQQQQQQFDREYDQGQRFDRSWQRGKKDAELTITASGNEVLDELSVGIAASLTPQPIPHSHSRSSSRSPTRSQGGGGADPESESSPMRRRRQQQGGERGRNRTTDRAAEQRLTEQQASTANEGVKTDDLRGAQEKQLEQTGKGGSLSPSGKSGFVRALGKSFSIFGGVSGKGEGTANSSATASAGSAIGEKTTSATVQHQPQQQHQHHQQHQEELKGASSSVAPRAGGAMIPNSAPTAKLYAYLCNYFGISTTSVFSGEVMKKKFSRDFVAKDSFIWIDAHYSSLHWAKSPADRHTPIKQKFILLDRDGSRPNPITCSSSGGGTGSSAAAQGQRPRPSGEMKGILSAVESLAGGGFVVRVESGEALELKLSSEGDPVRRQLEWIKVIRSYLS